MKSLIILLIMVIITNLLFSDIVKIRVTNYPPHYYRDSDNNWTGIDVELSKAIVSEAGLTPVFIELPWSRALKEIQEGSIDMMVNLSITEQRSVFLNWIGPERKNNMILILNKEHDYLEINNEEDLILHSVNYDKPIGIQQDAFYSIKINTLINDKNYSKHFDTITKSELNYQKLLNNRLLAIIDEQLTAVYLIKNTPEFKKFYIHPFIISSSDVYFGVSKKYDIENLHKIQQAYNKLEKNGSLQAIRDKYSMIKGD